MTKKSYFLSADVSGVSLKISWQKVVFLVIQNYALLFLSWTAFSKFVKLWCEQKYYNWGVGKNILGTWTRHHSRKWWDNKVSWNFFFRRLVNWWIEKVSWKKKVNSKLPPKCFPRTRNATGNSFLQVPGRFSSPLPGE